jgi:hypothetical protein
MLSRRANAARRDPIDRSERDEISGLASPAADATLADGFAVSIVITARYRQNLAVLVRECRAIRPEGCEVLGQHSHGREMAGDVAGGAQ